MGASTAHTFLRLTPDAVIACFKPASPSASGKVQSIICASRPQNCCSASNSPFVRRDSAEATYRTVRRLVEYIAQIAERVAKLITFSHATIDRWVRDLAETLTKIMRQAAIGPLTAPATARHPPWSRWLLTHFRSLDEVSSPIFISQAHGKCRRMRASSSRVTVPRRHPARWP